MTGDAGFVMVSTVLVWAMVFGVALFYGAFDHQQSSRAAYHVLVAAFLSQVQWYVVGYAMAFGTDVAGILGMGMPRDWSTPSQAVHLPHSAFSLFQAAFAAVTVALVYRSVRAPVSLIGLLAWLTFVYAPVAHWVWGDRGFIHLVGAVDFAGGLVVHVAAGATVLALALVGPRAGRTPGHHDPGQMLLGTAVLWVGWFGFNAGSALRADGLAASALLATNLAACAGALSYRHRDGLTGLCLGAVSGLVAITPAAGSVGPGNAALIGLAAGLLCSAAQRWLEDRLDDPMDVVAVHGVGGVLGSVATGLVMGSPHQVGVQVGSVVIVGSYAMLATILLCLMGVMYVPVHAQAGRPTFARVGGEDDGSPD